MSKRPCAKTMHQIALMAQETADVWREGLLECGSIYERIRIQGGIDALDDFADSLWLKMNDPDIKVSKTKDLKST